MDHIAAKLDKQGSRLGEVEQRLSTIEDDVQMVSDKSLSMEKVLAIIQAKNDDLEVRSRRNNVRVTRLLE